MIIYWDMPQVVGASYHYMPNGAFVIGWIVGEGTPPAPNAVFITAMTGIQQPL